MKKICTKCKIEKDVNGFSKDKRNKDGVRCWCKQCEIECVKKWREENPEYMKKYNKKWYIENKEEIKEYNKKWREENPEYMKKWIVENPEYNKKWLVENPEYFKKWYQDNIEHIKKTHKIWREKNPEKVKEKNRKRRAIKFNTEGKFTEKEFKEKLIFYQYKCCACGTDLRKAIIHRDHIQPLSKGGNDDIENIQPLCAYCNCSKHTKHRDYRDHWLQRYAI